MHKQPVVAAGIDDVFSAFHQNDSCTLCLAILHANDVIVSLVYRFNYRAVSTFNQPTFPITNRDTMPLWWESLPPRLGKLLLHPYTPSNDDHQPSASERRVLLHWRYVILRWFIMAIWYWWLLRNYIISLCKLQPPLANYQLICSSAKRGWLKWINETRSASI